MNRIPEASYKALPIFLHVPKLRMAWLSPIHSLPSYPTRMLSMLTAPSSVPAEPNSEDWVLSRYLGKSDLGAGMNIYNVRYENYFSLATNSPVLCLPMCPDLFQLASNKESELSPAPKGR